MCGESVLLCCLCSHAFVLLFYILAKSELLPMRLVETYIKTVFLSENVQFSKRVQVNRGDVERGSCFSFIYCFLCVDTCWCIE